MTISKTLELILKRLDEIEAKIATLPSHESVSAMIATTAERDDLHSLEGTLGYISDQIEDQERRQALTEIRADLRRVS